MLSPQELELVNKLKSEGASDEAIKTAVTRNRLLSPSTPSNVSGRVPQQIRGTKTVGEDFGGDFKELFSNVYNRVAGEDGTVATFKAATEMGNRDADTPTEALGNVLRASGQMVGEGLGTATDLGGELFAGVGKLILSEDQEVAISQAFQKALEPVTGSSVMQGAMSDYEWLKENDPDRARDFRAMFGALMFATDVATAGTGAPMFMSAKAGTEGIETGVKAGIKTGLTTGAKAGETSTAEGIAASVARGIENRADDIARSVDDARIKTERIRNSDPLVGNAIKADVPDPVINMYVNSNDVQKSAYRDVVTAFKAGDNDAVTDIFSTLGKSQYDTVLSKLDEIGLQYDEAFASLPNGTIDNTPAITSIRRTLTDIGATFDNNGKLVDAGRTFTPDEAKWVTDLYNVVNRYSGNVTYNELRTADEVLSRINREAYKAGVNPPRLPTEMGGDNLSTYIRDVVRGRLDEVLPQYRDINNDYRSTITFKDALDKTIYKSGRDLGIDLDTSGSIENNLRRIFSNAQTADQYKQITRLLDEYSRLRGYEGADLEPLIEFSMRVRSLYPETVKPGSLPGGIMEAIRGVVSAKPDIRKTQEALEQMVGAANKSGAVKDIAAGGAAIGVVAYLYENPEAFDAIMNSLPGEESTQVIALIGAASASSKIPHSVVVKALERTAVRIAELEKRVKNNSITMGEQAELKSLKASKKQLEKEAKSYNATEPEGRGYSTQAKADKAEGILAKLGLSNRSVSSPNSITPKSKNRGFVKNPLVGKAESATTKTTDLLEEAKKYDSAEEFRDVKIKELGKPVYRGTKDGGELRESMETDYGDGFYFADKKDTANSYGETVDGYFVNLKNPLEVENRYAMNGVVDEFLQRKQSGETKAERIREYLKEQGYDGIRVKDGGIAGDEGTGGFTVAFDKEQAISFEDIADSDDWVTVLQNYRTQLEDIWKQANAGGH